MAKNTDASSGSGAADKEIQYVIFAWSKLTFALYLIQIPGKNIKLKRINIYNLSNSISLLNLSYNIYLLFQDLIFILF